MAQKYKSGDSGNFEMPLKSHKGLGLKSEKVSSWLIRKMESKKKKKDLLRLLSYTASMNLSVKFISQTLS